MRILAAFGFSLVVALAGSFPVIGAGLGLAICGAVVARLPCLAAMKRLASVNVLMLILFVTFNAAGSAGDLIMVAMLMSHPHDALMQDNGSGVDIYQLERL